MKITFKIGQWGAIHFIYSSIFLLLFNLMLVYLCISDSNTFSGEVDLSLILSGVSIAAILLLSEVNPIRFY